MKKIILILITILISTIVTSQVRFNYIKHVDIDEKYDSTGIIYFTTDPDTVITNAKEIKACLIYEFDNEDETVRYIPIYRIKMKKKETIYYGKWEKDLFKITYNKQYGDFVMKERALLPINQYTIFFHRDYDYYDQLTEE